MNPFQNHTARKLKYIEKLKIKGMFNDYKKKRAELEKARRIRHKDAMKKLTDLQRKLLMDEERMKNRKRVQKCRQNKKHGLSAEDTSQAVNTQNKNINQETQTKSSVDFANSYKTQSAIRKAYCKTNKTLPSSPSKRKVIVAKLVRSFDDKDRQDIFGNSIKSTANKKKTGLSSALVTAIQNFYERDDISRISPNVKDAKSFRNPATNQKELKQLRHLIFKLSEVYNKFVEEYKRENNSDPPVKLSKFCELRPKHVILIAETPRNVCFCIYHSNFSQCCTAINKCVPELPKTHPEMIKLLVCDNPNRDCYFKTCKNCSASVINSKLKAISQYSTNKNKPVQWFQWIKNKKANRFQNEQLSGTLQKLVDYLLSIYEPFLVHSYIMHEQHDNFNMDQKRVDLEQHFDEATLQIDFPENFKCESQDEIQQANYNQKQISLFISALRHAKILHSKAIASDNTHHAKETIVAYLYKIFLTLPSTVKKVKIWSDGPRSQFKNKFIGAVILLFEKLFKVKIFWNFFATAHGKACVDGIGATVKKKVRIMILSKEKIVYGTKDFVDAFNSKESKVDLFGLTPEEIEQINVKLKLSELIIKAPTIPGISRFHQLQVVNGRVKGFITSKDGYENQN